MQSQPHQKKLKFRYEGEIRTIVIQHDCKFSDLRKRLLADYGFDHSLKYEDDDGDYVTLCNQNDLESLLLNDLQTVNVYISEALPNLTRGHMNNGSFSNDLCLFSGNFNTNGISSGGIDANSSSRNLVSPLAISPTISLTSPHNQNSESFNSTVRTSNQIFPQLLGGSSGGGGGDRILNRNVELGGEPIFNDEIGGSTNIGLYSISDKRRNSTSQISDSAPGIGNSAVNASGNASNIVRIDSGRLPPPMQMNVPRRLKREQAFDRNIRWKKGEMIGQGAFGVVYLGLNIDSGELMAVKQMAVDEVSQRDLTTLENEIKLLQNLRHQNIVRYIGTETNSSFLSIFLEYIPGGSIKSLIDKFGSLDEAVVRSYARQILLGMEYLHRHGFAHRDIKGANCLVGNDGVVKLADFGSSKNWRTNKDGENNDGKSNGNEIKGTPCWMAPEVVRDQGAQISWKKADVWSMACTALEMASGKAPWSQFSNSITIIYHIACQDTLPQYPESASPELVSFLNICLQRDASIRPDTTSLLLHPFVANFGNSWSSSSKAGVGLATSNRPTTVSTAPQGGGFVFADGGGASDKNSANYNIASPSPTNLRSTGTLMSPIKVMSHIGNNNSNSNNNNGSYINSQFQSIDGRSNMSSSQIPYINTSVSQSKSASNSLSDGKNKLVNSHQMSTSNEPIFYDFDSSTVDSLGESDSSQLQFRDNIEENEDASSQDGLDRDGLIASSFELPSHIRRDSGTQSQLEVFREIDESGLRYKKNNNRSNYGRFDNSDVESVAINDNSPWDFEISGASIGTDINNLNVSESTLPVTEGKVRFVSAKGSGDKSSKDNIRHSAHRSAKEKTNKKNNSNQVEKLSLQPPKNSSIPYIIDANLGGDIDLSDSIATISAFSPIRTMHKQYRGSASNSNAQSSQNLNGGGSNSSNLSQSVGERVTYVSKKEKERLNDLESSLDSLDLKITGSATSSNQKQKISGRSNSISGASTNNSSGNSAIGNSNSSLPSAGPITFGRYSKIESSSSSNNGPTSTLNSNEKERITDVLYDSSDNTESNENNLILGNPDSLLEHTAAVTRLKMPKRTKLLISSSLDGTVRIWGTENESRAVLDMNLANFAEQRSERRILLGNNTKSSSTGPLPGSSTSSSLPGQGMATLGDAGSSSSATVKATNVWAEDSCESIWGVGSDNSIRVWAGAEGRMVKLLKGHEDAITVIEGVSGVGGPQESCLVATGSADKSVRIWDIRAKRSQIFIFKGHSDAVTAIRWGEGGRTVFSSSKDKTIRIWDTRAGRVRATLEKHFGSVNALRAIPEVPGNASAVINGASFISAGRDSMLNLWTVDGDCLLTQAAHRGGVQFISEVNFEFNRNFAAVVTLGGDNAMKVWDLKKLRCVVEQSLPSSYGTLTKAVWFGRSIVTGSSTGIIRQWNIRNNTTLQNSSSDSLEGATEAGNDIGSCMISTDIGSHSSPCTDLIMGESMLASSSKSGQIFRWMNS